MELSQLWGKLIPDDKDVENIKSDLKLGLAPNLPFFVIDTEEVKEKLGIQLKKIDTHFQFALIQGDYGNGKTNMLKYLENYFLANPKYGVKVSIWRADIDRYDVILQLLYILQIQYNSQIINCFKSLTEKDSSDYCNNFNDSFEAIHSYVDKIIENKDNHDALITLLALGTGKLHNANIFSKYNLSKLTDYNRREILVFLLNLLAANNIYVIFCLDELEKILEKSKARFQGFLTTFRELIDLSSYIKGGMIIATMTNSVGENEQPLETYNQAFARRIGQNKYELKAINKQDELQTLVRYLSEFMGARTENTNEIVSSLLKLRLSHNSEYVIETCKKIMQADNKPKDWKDLLDILNLRNKFKDVRRELIEDGVKKGIHTKFFKPLDTYIKIIGVKDMYEMKEQHYQCVYNKISAVCTIFLFSSDVEQNLTRIRNVAGLYPGSTIQVFETQELGLNSMDLKFLDRDIHLYVYDPLDGMAILRMVLDEPNDENIMQVAQSYFKTL